MNATRDPLGPLARYYDVMMDHVDYGQWAQISRHVASLLGYMPVHLDVACGTGKLLGLTREFGWRSCGVDLSQAMLHEGRKKHDHPLAAADMCALPFDGTIDFITCLFDSLNFLLVEEDIDRAFQAFYKALDVPGLLYFDIVTERMVSQHFANRTWSEDNGQFSTAWRSTYAEASGIADSHIRINTGPESCIRERIYPTERFEQAAVRAGFHVLGMHDADTWGAVRRRTTRIDFVLLKGDPAAYKRPFKRLRSDIKRLL